MATRENTSWKSAFLACIDHAPATDEFKMLQLKQCLAGEALCAIEHLGHSAAAHDAAKERLERMFGGKRRQTSIYYEEIDQFQQIQTNHSKDLEQYAKLLEQLVIKLKEAGQLNLATAVCIVNYNKNYLNVCWLDIIDGFSKAKQKNQWLP